MILEQIFVQNYQKSTLTTRNRCPKLVFFFEIFFSSTGARSGHVRQLRCSVAGPPKSKSKFLSKQANFGEILGFRSEI